MLLWCIKAVKRPSVSKQCMSCINSTRSKSNNHTVLHVNFCVLQAKYIQQCIEEIKDELKQGSPVVKANAIAKVTYLQMLGYDMSWAAFNVIEVMSSARFTQKRIGYLGASQSFHDDTEVLMLATNLIRKDINSHNQYDAGKLLHLQAVGKS